MTILQDMNILDKDGKVMRQDINYESKTIQYIEI